MSSLFCHWPHQMPLRVYCFCSSHFSFRFGLMILKWRRLIAFLISKFPYRYMLSLCISLLDVAIDDLKIRPMIGATFSFIASYSYFVNFTYCQHTSFLRFFTSAELFCHTKITAYIGPPSHASLNRNFTLYQATRRIPAARAYFTSHTLNKVLAQGFSFTFHYYQKQMAAFHSFALWHARSNCISGPLSAHARAYWYRQAYYFINTDSIGRVSRFSHTMSYIFYFFFWFCFFIILVLDLFDWDLHYFYFLWYDDIIFASTYPARMHRPHLAKIPPHALAMPHIFRLMMVY
jgi:hypothetical protein